MSKQYVALGKSTNIVMVIVEINPADSLSLYVCSTVQLTLKPRLPGFDGTRAFPNRQNSGQTEHLQKY